MLPDTCHFLGGLSLLLLVKVIERERRLKKVADGVFWGACSGLHSRELCQGTPSLPSSARLIRTKTILRAVDRDVWIYLYALVVASDYQLEG